MTLTPSTISTASICSLPSTRLSNLSTPVVSTPSLSLLEPDDADIFSTLYETPLGERAFAAINGHVFDKTGSVGLYSRTFSEEWYATPNRLLLIMGCDGGLMLSYLEHVAKGEGRRVLIVELPEMIDWLEENHEYDHDFIELLPANGNLSLLVSEKYNGYLYRNAIGIHRSLVTLDQYHPAYARLWQVYEPLIHRFFFSQMIEIHGSLGFINAQLLNIADNQHSIHHLYHQFDGGVAVLLAGGPSLDDAIDWIKENRARITLFAVGRVCARLKNEGIDPDFIGAVDPNEISFDNSKQMLLHDKKSTFLHAYHVNPRLLSQFRGHSFYQGKRYPWFKIELDANEQFTAPGPTITNTLISFMTHMGFEHIIFAGVDMCHKRDGQSHESGSLESQVGRFVGTYRATQFVTTNSGQLAPTTPDLFSAHQTLQLQVKGTCAHFKTLRFYNPSPDAAHIDGVEHIAWQDLVLPEWDNKAPETVDACVRDLKFNEDKFSKATLKELQRMRRRFLEASRGAKAGIKSAKHLFDSEEKTIQQTAKVSHMRNRIDKALGGDLPVLMDYLPRAFHDALTVDMTQEQDNDAITQALTHYFSAIQASCNALIQMIDSAQELVKLRQLERERAVLSIDLVKGWIRYGQPGRLYVWLDLHKRTKEDLSKEEETLAYPLIRAFDAIFKVTETGLVKKFKASVHDNTLDSVIKSMQKVDEESIDKLEEVLTFCEENVQKDEFYRDLGLFILGYFSSLRGEVAEAYSTWEMVEHKKLQEQVQVSSLTLALSQRDYNHALQVLEKLCVRQHGYLTVYASILLTLGQEKLAREVLAVYVQKMPEDMAARLQLARLLLDAKELTQAKTLLEDAHQYAPKNPMIQRLWSEAGGIGSLSESLNDE